MSRPPRIPNWLPWEKSTIYFITFCVAGRKPVLTNPQTWQIIRAAFRRLGLATDPDDWPYQYQFNEDESTRLG
jgi:hypothetical protein